MLTKEDLEMLSDTEVLDIYDNARSKVAFYNAADGSSWHNETDGRQAARRWLAEVQEEVDSRDLKPRKGNYLL